MSPLHGTLVLDFSQFLSGPVASLRLADLGARVIKIERPGVGDIGRRLAFAGIEVDGDTLPFHVFNRGKESVTCDLKDPSDLVFVRRLIERADVLVQNFRPGVMERLGLGYDAAREINPRIVYGSVSGYGPDGPWRDHPGQDLLAQARAGLPWLNGTRDMGPVPVGIAIADVLAACHLVTGILACLVRRERTGVGGLVETSLLEAMVDLQFEVVSAHLNDHSIVPRRGPESSAHAFLPAPYGVYPTSDGFIAIAMGSVPHLGEVIGVDELAAYDNPNTWFTERDSIIGVIAARLRGRSTDAWLDVLLPAGIWCGPVHTLADLVDEEGFAALRMAKATKRTGADGSEVAFVTTRAPFTIDRTPLGGAAGAPRLGANDTPIRREFGQ